MIRTLVFVLALLLAGCGGKPKKELNVFFWSDYIDMKVVAEFERRFDCRVHFDYHEDPESMMAKLSAGGDSSYDIVVPSDNYLPILIERGLLAPLRRENIPNLKNLAPEFTKLSADPGNRYGSPYFFGFVGLYVRPTANRALDESWALLFDPAKQAGSFLLMDDVRGTLGAALKYKGWSLNSTNKAEVAAARDLLIGAKKRSLGFEGSVGSKNRVLAKGAGVVMAYNTDALKGIREDAATRFFVPREGSQIYVDFLSIPAKAPHRDLAEAFINFILEPEIGGRLAEFNLAGTPNLAARAFLDPAHRQNPAIYPTAEVLARLEYANDLREQNRLYDEVWTQMKVK